MNQPFHNPRTMADQAPTGTDAVHNIVAAAQSAATKGPPPVHLWNPPFCGNIDMRVAADGTWFYGGTPLGRPALVKLFASILWREGDRYFLVTPVEKCGIIVEDAPFLAVEMRVIGDGVPRRLWFRTNVEDWVECGPGHPLRFEQEAGTGGLKPSLHVRRNLWAKLTRSLFFDLVSVGETRDFEGVATFGIVSAGQFYAMARADEIEGCL